MIVEELSTAWGVQQFLPGKIVWFEVAPDVTMDRRDTMRA
jgi:hypothetical protein